METRRSGSFSKPVLALTAVFLLTLVLVPPFYEVPQNDDWAYYLTIQNWFQTGHLAHLGWNDPTLVFQILWGSLFARLFGLSYTSLRISTLILSWIGALSFYGILRHLRWSQAAALLGAGLLLMNPIPLVLSYSFNTDVPYVALATAGTFMLLKAEERRSRTLYLLTGLVLAAAFLVRQQGLVLAVIAAVWVALRRSDEEDAGRFQPDSAGSQGGAGRLGGDADRLRGDAGRLRGEADRSRGDTGRFRVGAAALILGPVLAAIIGHGLWFHGATGGLWPWQFSSTHRAFRHPDAETIRALLQSSVKGWCGLILTIGFLLIPLFVASLGPTFSSLRRRWSDRAVLLLAIGGFIAASFWLKYEPRGGWPYAAYSITRSGPGDFEQEIPLASWVWWIPNVLAPLLAGWVTLCLFRALAAMIRERAASPAALVLLLGLGQFLPSLFLESVYDRYVVVFLPALILAGFTFGMPKPSSVRLGLAVLVLCAGLSIEWTRAYVDHARARWELGEDLVQRGARPEEIIAGFEWQGEHLYPKALRELHLKPPFDLVQGMPWDPLVKPYYGVLAWAPYLTPIAERTYRPFLCRKRQKLVSVWTMAGPPGFAREPEK